ncbi:MAG: 50S ribosomal protein L29 [Patescibacteria group bacterium]
MKTIEMRQKSKEELGALLAEKRQKVLILRSLMHEKKVKNVRELLAVRKDVARVLTILAEK